MSEVIYGSLGGRSGTLWGHFEVNFEIFVLVFGGVLSTLGSPGVPKGGRLEKVAKKWFLRPSWVFPPEPLWRPKSVNNYKKSPAEKHGEGHCAQSTAQGVSWDAPSNLQNYGFVYVKPPFLHFHLYFQNGSKRYPMDTPLGGFRSRWAPFWQMKNRLEI